MNEKDWDLYLRMILLIVMALFLILMVVLPQNNCDNCSFKMEGGKNLNTGELLNEYFAVCIDPFTGEINRHGLNLSNFTLNKSTG